MISRFSLYGCNGDNVRLHGMNEILGYTRGMRSNTVRYGPLLPVVGNTIAI